MFVVVFKQKTAYEMRISDWSSDVCSSDLYRDEQTVGQGVDLLPTLASIVGARIPAGTDGVDLSPVIEGRALAERPDLYWAYGKEGAAKETPQPDRKSVV